MVRREAKVKTLVAACKKGDMYIAAGIGGRISELDEIIGGNFTTKVEHMIKEIGEDG